MTQKWNIIGGAVAVAVATGSLDCLIYQTCFLFAPRKSSEMFFTPCHWFRKKTKNPLGLPICSIWCHYVMEYLILKLLYYPYSNLASTLNALTVCQNTTNKDGLESINKVHDNTSGHKLKTYCSLKTQFGMENYVRGIPQSERRHFTKLKISAHHLSIERGRYTRPITPRSQRYCSDCKEQAIGDEFHFLL